jgi:hypothetical protein
MSVKKGEKEKPTRAEILALGDGPRVYNKQLMMALLGISDTTYHKLLHPDFRGRELLRSSRLFPGGPRVHTQKQYDDYLEYLNTEGQIAPQRLRRDRTKS